MQESGALTAHLFTDKTKSKRTQRAWAMYDWANSAYNLVITSTIFPAYYTAITSERNKEGTIINDTVSFFGFNFRNTALIDYVLAASFLLIAFLSPILSAVADYKGNKKTFMKLFCYIGGLACCGLFFFKADTLNAGVLLFAIAAIGYCGSLVFYNAYLPEIALPEDQDKVSAMGFSYGYIGSVLLQLICFLFVLKPELFGITDGTFAPRLSFLLVGIWWIAWSQISFKVLPKGTPLEKGENVNVFTKGFQELGKVWRQVMQMPVLKYFLLAFFFYSMGVQTVMLAATLFGSKVLNLETSQLITTILVIQLVAIAGSYLMAKLSEKIGNLTTLLLIVLVWIGVCIAAYYTTTASQFYIIAAVVGLIMGGIQSLSRSTYSKLMPETHDTTSFFSFYDVMEKLSIFFGMFSFGFIEEITGDMRNSILSLIFFFVVGVIILYIANAKFKAAARIREPRAQL